MRLLLVGDNGPGNNWGGRGVSLALRGLLSRRFDVSDRVIGREFLLDAAGYGFVGTLMPLRYDHIFLSFWQRRASKRIFDWYVRFEEAYGAHDYVSEDPRATADTLVKYSDRVPELAEIRAKVERADAVVINGEGEFVFTTPPRRPVLLRLGLMELARRAGKPTLFINAMLSDCPFTGRHLRTAEATHQQLAQCTGVLLRDPASIAYAREHMPDVKCALVPDALFAWHSRIRELIADLPRSGDLLMPHPEDLERVGKLDFSQPYICVGGSAGAALDNERAIPAYTRMVKGLQTLGLPVLLTENDGRDGFLLEVSRQTGAPYITVWTPIFAAAAILANARLFVSGRYHPSIMAALGGTPCIMLGTTAHKTESLQSLLEYETPYAFPVYPSDEDVPRIVDAARREIDAGEPRRQVLGTAAAHRAAEVETLPDRIATFLGAGSPR